MRPVMRSVLSVALKLLAVAVVVLSVVGAAVKIRDGEWVSLSAQLIGLAIAIGLWRLSISVKSHDSDYREGSSARSQ